jgi:surface protein
MPYFDFVAVLFGRPFVLLPGLSSPEGASSSLACKAASPTASPTGSPTASPPESLSTYTPLTDSNIKAAAILWVSNQTSATSTYGLVHTWDLSQVTSLEKVWCGYDATACSQAYVAMRSFNGDISRWDVSRVTTMWDTFRKASVFNSDISKWDVSKVTTMRNSKSIRMVENALTSREHAIAIGGLSGG